MVLTLETTDGGRWFKPGELVEGRAVGEHGRADQTRAGQRAQAGERDFSIRVPNVPYSFSGKLITLAWAIELVALPGGETERLDLVIGPQPVEVDLT